MERLTVEIQETMASLAIKRKALPDRSLFQVSHRLGPGPHTGSGTI